MSRDLRGKREVSTSGFEDHDILCRDGASLGSNLVNKLVHKENLEFIRSLFRHVFQVRPMRRFLNLNGTSNVLYYFSARTIL